MPINLDQWRIEAFVNQTSTPLVTLSGWIAPDNYLIAANPSAVGNADFFFDGNPVPSSTELRLVPPPNAHYLTHAVAAQPNGMYQRNQSSTTGNYVSTFSVVTNPTLYGGGLYEFVADVMVQVSEVLANPKSCSPLEIAIECGDYVKLYNPTDQAIDLSGLRLRVGYYGQNASSSNTFLISGVVNAGEYIVIARSSDDRSITVTNSGGYIWLEDAYGVKRYDSTIQEYADASSDSKKGQAWAYDSSDGTWKWTTQPAPINGPSVFPVVVAEPKKAAATLLSPCKEGQYRSEETNRCRSIATEASTLAPCAANQERNLETNRCRNIASLTNELVPCKPGQERNPETNRCRNATSGDIPEAAFAATPVADASKAFVGWWALGGVGLLGVGYGVWEWRREVGEGIRKLGSFFTSGK